jgi:ATP-binding cassette subfamily B protein
MKQPKIIILDDSTSAIDTATEKKFQQAFRENYQGMTIVIIAQRLQSIQDSDKIIILDDGKVVDIGTHDELVERNLIYREVYESQQEGSLL